MNTTRTIRLASSLIATIGAAVSYGTQRGLLLGWGVDALSATAIPVTVDLLGVICLLGIHAVDVTDHGRRVAYRVLAVVGAVSLAANALGGDTWGARAGHMWCVVAYLLGETVAAVVGKRRPAGPSATEVAEQTAAAKRSEASRRGWENRRQREAQAATAERRAVREARKALRAQPIA